MRICLVLWGSYEEIISIENIEREKNKILLSDILESGVDLGTDSML